MNDLMRRLLYLPEQASSVAADVDGLHFLVITTTMIGATGVFAVALYFSWRYRRRDEAALSPIVRAPLSVEIGIILALLALFIVFWLIGFQQFMRMQVVPPDAVEVYVTGKKWMWKYAYPDGRRSNETLVVPAGRPVKLVMTSRDVIHSFYVPAFRIKQDVLPGRYVTTWFEAVKPGAYQIYCAEFCGGGHSQMWGEVLALSGDEWERWLGAETPDAMAEQGAVVAAKRGCLSCHTLDGQRHLGPSFRGLYGSTRQLTSGPIVADDAYLTRSMMEPMAEIVVGFPPIMPTYQGQLEAREVGALLELIKSLRARLPAPSGIDYPLLPPILAPPPGQAAPPVPAPQEVQP